MARRPSTRAAARRPAGGRTTLGPLSLQADAQTPIYQQIVDGVVAGLRAGTLHKGDRLPSINAIRQAFDLSRETVVKGFEQLQKLGYVSAIHGKGYYVRTDAADPRIRAFVLFDTLNAYKERVFAGLVETVSHRVDLDVCFHHFNAPLFRRLIEDARGHYDRYVIMPFPSEEVREALAALEPERLLVLDIHACVPDPRAAWIVQNFDARLVEALASGLDRFRRYRRLTLVFPPGNHDPVEIQRAVKRFGRRAGMETTVLPSLSEHMVVPGTAYLVLDEKDLVSLVKGCSSAGLRLGEQVGVLSYNDTPLKEVVAGGISVVTIDFHGLGIRAGQYLLDPGPIHEVVPTRLLLRCSL